MPITISDKLMGELLKNSLSKTAFRVLLFLISSSDQPVSTGDISSAVGVSGKAVCKAVKRLVDAGILQPGESEARRRRFLIPGADRGDAGGIPEAIPHPEIGLMLDRIEHAEQELSDMSKKESQMIERIKRTEVALSSLTALIGASEGSKPNHPELHTSKTEPIIPLSIPGAVVTVPESGIQNATTNPPIIASSLALPLNNCIASLHAGQEFRELFGVSVPAQADMAAVAEMIRRKKAGKLADLKSPIGYLASLAGKITVPPTAPQVGEPVQHIIQNTTSSILDIERKADDLWDRLDESERNRYREQMAEKYKNTDSIRKPPIEVLARSEFRKQKLNQWGVSIS